MNIIKRYLKNRKELKEKENNAWKRVIHTELNLITGDVRYILQNKEIK